GVRPRASRRRLSGLRRRPRQRPRVGGDPVRRFAETAVSSAPPPVLPPVLPPVRPPVRPPVLPAVLPAGPPAVLPAVGPAALLAAAALSTTAMTGCFDVPPVAPT